MKRGKKSLICFSSMVLSCLFMLFFSSYKVEALDDSAFVTTCMDRENGTECSETTASENAYFILNKINIGSESISELTIPSTDTITIGSNVIEANIETMGDGENPVIETTTDLTLTTLTLPSSLGELKQYSLYNISSLTSVTLPNALFSIEANVFESNSNVEKIYLNHYELATLDKLVINVDAFDAVTLGKIICGSTAVYNHFVVDYDALDHLPFVLQVTYNYYPTENENVVDGKQPVTYYVGVGQTITSGSIPDAKDLTSEGLGFLGWYLKTSSNSYEPINENDTVLYLKDTTVYSVYPHYELNNIVVSLIAEDVNGNLIDNDNVVSYDGGNTVATLKINNLVIPTNYTKKYTWYKVGSVSDVELSNDAIVNLAYATDSGLYRCRLDYFYTSSDGVEYSSYSEATINIGINKAKLYISVEDVTKTYGTYMTEADIEYAAIGLLENDAIAGIEYEYMNSGDIGAAVYNAAVKVEVTSIRSPGNSYEKSGNYEVIYSYGNYIVNKKVIQISYDATTEFTYGDEILVRKAYMDENVYGNNSKVLVVHFARNPGNDVGTYKVIGVNGIKDGEGNNNDNYLIDYLSTSTGKVVINPKPVDIKCSLDGINCEDNNIITATYNGKVRNLIVYYEDINGVKIEVPHTLTDGGNNIDNIVNAGEYVAQVTSLLDDNYTYASNGDKVIYVDVNKATEVPQFDSRQTFTYTGEKVYPHITISNSEQSPIFHCTYENNSGNYCINQGTYNVKVTYPESDNYNEVIVPGIRVDIDYLTVNISPKEYSFPYGTSIVAKDTIKINGEDVEVVYSVTANSSSVIGSYDITGVTVKDSHSSGNHPNYKGSINYEEGKGKIKVVKRPVEIVYYNYENLVYDGKEKVIGAYAVDTISNQVVNLNIELVCDEGEIKNANTYHLRSYFSSDYYEAVNSNLLVFTVEKAKYDLSHIKFNDGEFKLDFKEHAISIDGALPEGVSVVYSIEGETGNSTSKAFSHTVVAKFIVDEANYLPVDDLQATIYIDMTWVFVTVFLVILAIGVAGGCAWLYVLYRRKHPKKIKLKIKDLVDEDLAAKRVATSVKEVLGDESVEGEHIENEDDIIEGKGPNRNFIDRIYAASSEVKYYYSEVKNELLSYEGVSHSVDRKYEVFYHGTRQIAKLSICNGILRLYVNLDPQKYDKKQYNHRDMSKIEIHARTPLRIDVNTTESLRHAKVFIRILRKKENLKVASNFVRIDYEKFYTLKENVFPKIFKKMFNINHKNSEKK